MSKGLSTDTQPKVTGATLSDEARAKRNEYRRKWYQRNKNKCKEYNIRYWERKAAGCEGEVK